jgi:hypothetical protein
MDIQTEVQKIHHQFGVSEKANYEIQKLFDKAIKEAVTEALRQQPVISCVCPNEIKTGTVSIDCCNLCGKPDEDWWGKHYR